MLGQRASRLGLATGAFRSLYRRRKPKYRDRVTLNSERDHCTFAVVGDANAWSDVVTLHASVWVRAQAFTIADDGFGITGRTLWRAGLGDVLEQFSELIFRLGRKNYSITY